MKKTISRFFKLTDDNCFIFGPRGSGKSTWLRENLGEAYVINLLDEVIYLAYLSNPGYLKEVVLGNLGSHKTFVIDEIQKIPQLLDSIHDLIETQEGIRFIITGSSSRKLKRSGVNLLASRAILKKMHPFMAAELGALFDLEDALKYGLIPLIITSSNPAEKLASYISLYLKEEVQAESLVRNIGDFARFLQVISFSHAAILNTSNVARECSVSRKIVDNYISILEDLLLGYLLPVFSRRAMREVVSHPKFYYFDAGVYYALRPKGPLDKPSEIDGAGLEGLVLQHLRAWSDYSQESCELYYWRTKANTEVDFIIYGNKFFIAIEVKNSNKISSKDLTELKSFAGDYPEAKLVLLYRGKDKLVKDDVICWPVDKFLLELKPDIFPGM